MKALRFSDRAEADLADIVRHLHHRTADRRVGLGVARALALQCHKLAELSGTLGRPRPELADGVRSFPYHGYVIFFRYEGDELVVLNVLSERREIDTVLGDSDD